MNAVILPRKRWQQIFDAQMLIALIVTILERCLGGNVLLVILLN